MRGAAPGATLDQLWQQLIAQYGAFGGLGDAQVAPAAPYMNATVQARFADATVPLIVTVGADGRVAGLHLGTPVPTVTGSPSPTPSPAAYVDPAAFTATEVTVGAAPWALPGTLLVPIGVGPFPAVVLVAGSGPQDRDETIGPNTPLRDIAEGLASKGIAVLRYDKRTRAHGSEMAADPSAITVREETIDDAVAAVDLLRATPGIDPERVFVAGHSLGGYLAPRIAAQAPGRLAGIALLEANSSPLPQLIVDQYAYLASREGGGDQQAAAALETVRAQASLAGSAALSASTPASQLPLGVPAAYWLDLRTYDPLATIAGLSVPVFLAQGGRDYQVPPSELDAWRDALAGRHDVSIREYPELNHLLMAGSGPSRPAEYNVPGHVASEVVEDLAAWIQRPSGS
jgi:dienelactone hydrolase